MTTLTDTAPPIVRRIAGAIAAVSPFPEGERARAKLLLHLARKAEAEMVQLEETMSLKRQWLDTNRDHPKWATRRERFFAGEVARHAGLGSAIERAREAAYAIGGKLP